MLKISGIHMFVDLLTGVIITLFLWNEVSFAAALEFRILELLSIPITTLLVGWIIDRASSKISFLIGLVCLFVEILIVWWLSHVGLLGSWLWVPAVISGVSAVARFLSLSILIQTNVPIERQSTFFSNSNIIWQALSVGFPVVSGVVIVQLGYQVLFAVAALVVSLLILIVFFKKTQFFRNPFRPLQYLKSWQQIDGVLARTYFFWGVEFAFFSVVLPVIIAGFFGGEQAWGVVTAVLAGVNISFSFLAKKFWSAQLPYLLGLGGFLLSIVALWYSANPGIILFCSLLVVIQVWQAAQSLALKPLANMGIAQRSAAGLFTTEMSLFLEWPFMLGRMVSLLFVLGVQPMLDNQRVLGVLFVLISLVPLYEMKTFWSGRSAKASSSTFTQP